MVDWMDGVAVSDPRSKDAGTPVRTPGPIVRAGAPGALGGLTGILIRSHKRSVMRSPRYSVSNLRITTLRNSGTGRDRSRVRAGRAVSWHGSKQR